MQAEIKITAITVSERKNLYAIYFPLVIFNEEWRLPTASSVCLKNN